MTNRNGERETAKRCMELIETLPAMLPARITDAYRPVKTRRLGHTSTHITQDTPKSSNNSFASSASTPRIEVSSARRNWSTQDYKDTSILYKDRGRNMKHLGDRHYQQASKAASESGSGSATANASASGNSSGSSHTLKILASCELVDAVLMYVYGFWCEDRSSVPNIQNWHSLEPLAKFARSKWDALADPDTQTQCHPHSLPPQLLAHMQGLALLVYALVLFQIATIDATQLFHKSIKLQRTGGDTMAELATQLLAKSIENHKRKEKAKEILDKAIDKFPSTSLKLKFPRTWARAVGGYLGGSESASASGNEGESPEDSEEMRYDRDRAASLGVKCDSIRRVKMGDKDTPSESLDPDSVLGIGGHAGGGFAWPLLEGGFAHEWWPHVVVFARSVLDEFAQTVRLDEFQTAAKRGYVKLK